LVVVLRSASGSVLRNQEENSVKYDKGEMTPRERFFRAMACKEVDRPPVCGMTTTATVQLMDKVNAAWPDAHTDAKLMSTIALGAPDFFGFESVRIPYCLTYEAEALGCNVFLGKKNSTPMVKSHPYRDDPDAELVLPKPKDILEMPRNKVIIESAKYIKKKVGKELPTLLGVTGPFTIAGHLVGTENLLYWIVTAPEKVHKFVKFAAQYEREWLKIVETLGIDLIQMSEPSASWDMMSADMFEEYALPYIKMTYEPLENTKKVLHICGNTTVILDHMINTGADGLSIEEKVDPYKAVEVVNGRAALVGNVGVVKPLRQGTPEDGRQHALRSADAGFNIISAGCGMSALIDVQNVRAMSDAIKGMSKKR